VSADDFGADLWGAERAVLAAVMESDGRAIDELTLKGEDFSDPHLGDIYDLMLAARLNGQHVTYATVLDKYPGDGTLIGGIAEYRWLAASLPEHAAIVAKHALRRRLEAAAAGLMERIKNPNLDADQLIEQARSLVDGAAGRQDRPVRFLRDILPGLVNRVEDHSQFVETPWPSLDGCIGGFRPGALYVIGGRPATGKSVIAAQCAAALAKHGLVAFSSLEMGEEELTARFAAMRIPMEISKIQDGQMKTADWERFALRRRAIEDLWIAIDDRTNVSISDIRQYARDVSRRGPLAGLIVDYLQLVRSDNPKLDRRIQIGEASRQLKVIAKDLHIPVIVLSQLNRQSEQRADSKPRIHELKESGDIEADADVVILLSRSKVLAGERILLDVAKNRHGPVAEVGLKWEGWSSRAIEWPEEALIS
jgi:replicative DNA helicase